MAAIAVATLLLAVVLPAFRGALRQAAMRSNALRVSILLKETRNRAETLERGTAVRFFQSGGAYKYAIYEDGNGNGVRNNDIASGVDRLIEGPKLLFPDLAVTPGVTEATPDPDTGRPFLGGVPAVNFNRSILCSFSPDGDGTPGTIYFTDGGLVCGVRSSGSGGAVYILYYDPGKKTWTRVGA